VRSSFLCSSSPKLFPDTHVFYSFAKKGAEYIEEDIELANNKGVVAFDALV
jgi:hypothetical protein